MGNTMRIASGGVLAIALAAFATGCLKHPEKARSQLEPGWKQSEMLVMSFNLQGGHGIAALDGLVDAISAAQPRYVALQDLTKAQADVLAMRLCMRADWKGSGADMSGPSGVAVLSRGERVMSVWSVADTLELPWIVNNPPKAMPKSAVSVQFAEHNIASVLLAADGDRAAALQFAREIPRLRPPVMSLALGAGWKGDAKLCEVYDKRYRTCSPEDAAGDTLISTPWNFSSQFGLDWNRRVVVKGFGGREAVLANIKY